MSCILIIKHSQHSQRVVMLMFVFPSLFCPNSLGLVTSGTSSLWQPAPGNGNDLHRRWKTSPHQPTWLVLRHRRLAAAARSHCRLRQQQRYLTVPQKCSLLPPEGKCIRTIHFNCLMQKLLIPESSWKLTTTVSIQALSVFLGSSTYPL